MNQVMLSNLMVQLGNHLNAKIEESMVRHMILNSLRSYKQKYSLEFGEMVIACDNTNYWRKKLFPYYKANRKEAQAKSELDWNQIFECLNHIRQELKEYGPYRVIDVESAEADDIIATLVKNFHEKILILSGDKDFIQLHVYPHVRQYDPVHKYWITHDNPRQFLKEHIINGDKGDGVPNILSPDNCFVIKQRQKPMTKKRMEQYIGLDSTSISDTVIARNYERNEKLIDLSNIPREISEQVIEQYNIQSNRDRSKLLSYFMKYHLKHLTECISEF